MILRAAMAALVAFVPMSAAPDWPTAPAGNPFVDGWYADPDVAVYDGRYWVYPTSSRPYDQQTALDAFSSDDLVHWTKHPNILTTANVSWARRAVWAPAPVARNGKFYLFFGANDIQSDDELGGIGVAVADRPEGPYADAIGAPLIDRFVNGAQPIDQDVFVDDDGQAYLFYGGWGHANVVRLSADLTSTVGDFQEITPANYTEGSQVFKRNGKYYLMWSEGGWTGPDYSVSYAMADSVLGPYTEMGKVLTQDPAVAKGSGHNAVLNVPGTDIWYIVYHRRPLSETDANHRQLAYDRMTFAPDGTINPVTMGVRDNFADGDAVGWKTYGSTWSAADGSYRATASAGGKALLDTNFADLTYEADVTLTSGRGDAGVVFRVTQPAVGTDSYRGYYAGISAAGRLVLGRADHGWTELASTPLAVAPGTRYHLRVEAVGPRITVYANDVRLDATDATFTTGATGVRVFQAAAAFDTIAVARK